MDFEKLLCCPMCKEELSQNHCAKCDTSYKKDEVYTFINPNMYSSIEAYKHAAEVIDFWGKGWEKRLKESDHSFVYDLNLNGLRQYGEAQEAWCIKNRSLMGVEVPLSLVSGKISLNIGCGAGTEALILANKGSFCIALDITKPAAAAADGILKKFDSGFGIQADSRYLPFKDCSVDIVYSSGVLHHSSDIAQSLAEIYRVLKPGGMAYIMLYATWSIVFVQQHILKYIFGLFGNKWNGEGAWETADRKNPHTTTYSVKECYALFHQFQDVQVSKRGGRVVNIAKIGKYLPSDLDKLIDSPLGPNLNIVAKK